MASLPQSSQKEVKQEVIDVEEFFGDGDIEITGYRQSPSASSVRKSRGTTRKREIIEIPDDDEVMCVDQPVTSIDGRKALIVRLCFV